jgi:hypothetical protein
VGFLGTCQSHLLRAGFVGKESDVLIEHQQDEYSRDPTSAECVSQHPLKSEDGSETYI